jgi:hypothetical protein
VRRVGGLFEAVVSRENLAAAAWRASRGKRDRAQIHEFFADLEGELRTIQSALARRAWRFGPYEAFQVRDTKTRAIHAPAFRDRVVHHAIINVAGPVLESGALHHSYACRSGRGQHAALRVARHWTRRTDWYGKIDVEKFYDSVDHATLRRMLHHRFRDVRLLDLFEQLLASYHATPGKGLPIGALTSQYLGNFYLDDVDRRIKATGVAHRYLRYMDDIVVWGTPQSLSTVRAIGHEALASVGLRARHGGEWNRCAQGVPFLGFVVYPDRIRVGRHGRARLRRKLRTLERRWIRGGAGERELQDRGTSLFAHVTTADDSAWRRTVLSFGRSFDDEREAQEPRPRGARRLLEQRCQEVPLRLSQQQEARQAQRQPGLSCLSGSRHGGREQPLASPDDVPSCSDSDEGPDESSGKPSAGAVRQRWQQPDRATTIASAVAPPAQDSDR